MLKNLKILPKLRDSLSFLYVEHAIIEQEDLAIVMIRKEGRTPVPIASLTTLMIGPGVSITHAAVRAIYDNGCLAFLRIRYRGDAQRGKPFAAGAVLRG